MNADDERKELIEQLNNDSNWLMRWRPEDTYKYRYPVISVDENANVKIDILNAEEFVKTDDYKKMLERYNMGLQKRGEQ